MQLNQYTLFFIISIISAAITLIIAVLPLRFKETNTPKAFLFLQIPIFLWVFSIGAGMVSPNEGIALFWNVIRMIGVILAPVGWIIFVLVFTQNDRFLTPGFLTVINLIPLISIILMVTNQLHGLFIEEVVFLPYGRYWVDGVWTLGPYFWVHFTYSYILILTGDYLILKEALAMSRRYRSQSIALCVATIVPLLTNISFSFHLLPLKINYDPLGFVFAGLIFAWAMYRYNLFDITPIARRILVDQMMDAMIVIDTKYRIVDINPAAMHILQINDFDVFGQPVEDIFPAKINIPKLLLSNQSQRMEFPIQRDNLIHTYDIQVSTIYHKKSRVGQLILARDVTEKKEIVDQLQKLAITDSLTGLFNHRHFYELLDTEYKRALRLFHPFSVIIFDIDHFKKVNDKFGHINGDQILTEIATICQEGLRQYDIFSRYGGEEFAILLPETDIHQAVQTAERLRQIVEDHTFILPKTKINLTISLGVATLPLDMDKKPHPEALVDWADRAMYHSKSNGRNLVSVWEESFSSQSIQDP